MRIAFITFEYPPLIGGGAGIYAINVTRELAKMLNDDGLKRRFWGGI